MHPAPINSIQRRKFLKGAAGLWLLSWLSPEPVVAGSLSAFDYPERPVREFLKIHFASSRKFSPSGMDGKERFLTRRFRSGIYRYFERSLKSDKSLPMVADPFTGSMKAESFSVGDAKVRSEKAWAPVSIRENANEWTMTYVLRNDQERNDDRWRIDDIQDVRGNRFSETLKKL